MEEDKALGALQQNLRSSLATTLPSPPLSPWVSLHKEQRWGGGDAGRTRWGVESVVSPASPFSGADPNQARARSLSRTSYVETSFDFLDAMEPWTLPLKFE